MNKKYICFFLLFCLMLGGLAGCKKKQTDKSEFDPIVTPTSIPTLTPTPTPTPTIEPTPIVEESHEGMAISKLTGEWVELEVANSRPYAMMLNNIVYANPQSGIGDASILYEALVEGGITRLMGIYEGIDPESDTAKRIGSIRSARHYFVSFADEYDAIFVHYGQTTYAEKKMNKLGIDTINGMSGVGVNSFYRDKSIKAPHNAFTSLKGINQAMEKGKYRTTYKEGYEGHYRFYSEDTPIEGEIATNIKLKYSNQITPILKYNEETKKYDRYQYDGEHIDYNTNEQLSFKNVIVWFVKEWNIDKNGYQTMDLEDASGEGYYITNGKLTKITWKKNEDKKWMRFYDESGNELTINPGKTYIAVFPNNRVKDVVIQ